MVPGTPRWGMAAEGSSSNPLRGTAIHKPAIANKKPPSSASRLRRIVIVAAAASATGSAWLCTLARITTSPALVPRLSAVG